MYRIPMRKVVPLKKNPYENFIDSYINNTRYTPASETWETMFESEIDPNKFQAYWSVYRRINELLAMNVPQFGYYYDKYFTDITQIRVLQKDFNIATATTQPTREKLQYIKTRLYQFINQMRTTQKSVQTGVGYDKYTKPIDYEEYLPESETETEASVPEIQDLLLEANLKWVFPKFKEEMPTTDAYYMAFYAGRSIYFPSFWSVDAIKTANLWSSQPRTELVWLIITYSISQGDYGIPGGMRCAYYPILPHVAYANNRKLYGMGWLRELIKPNFGVSTRLYDYFNCRGYYRDNIKDSPIPRDFPFKDFKDRPNYYIPGGLY